MQTPIQKFSILLKKYGELIPQKEIDLLLLEELNLIVHTYETGMIDASKILIPKAIPDYDFTKLALATGDGLEYYNLLIATDESELHKLHL